MVSVILCKDTPASGNLDDKGVSVRLVLERRHVSVVVVDDVRVSRKGRRLTTVG